MLNFQPIYEAK